MAGDYTLTPTKSGYIGFEPASSAKSVTTANVENVDFDSYQITGSVADAYAANMEGVTITLSGDDSGTTTTAADGTWTLNTGNGSFTVTPTIADYGFEPASRSSTVTDADDAVAAFRGNLALPVTFSFSGTNGQAPSGWTKPDNRTNTCTLIDQRNDSQSKEFTDYAQAVHLDADSSFGLAKDLGKGLPDEGFRMEVGFVSENVSQPPNPYVWAAFANALPWTAGTDAVQYGIKGNTNETNITFRKDSSNDSNDQAEAVNNDTWRECSKARLEYTKADDDVKCDWLQADAGTTLTQTEAYTTEFDDSLVYDYIGIWGGASSGTLADFDIIYVWIGKLSDTWPSPAYGTP
jgi:hypothetical protein